MPFCLARRESFKYAGSHSHCPIGVGVVTRVEVRLGGVRGPSLTWPNLCRWRYTRQGTIGQCRCVRLEWVYKRYASGGKDSFIHSFFKVDSWTSSLRSILGCILGEDSRMIRSFCASLEALSQTFVRFYAFCLICASGGKRDSGQFDAFTAFSNRSGELILGPVSGRRTRSTIGDYRFENNAAVA